jgi:SulP family sulfate permease
MARTRYQSSETTPPLGSLPAAALRAVLREGYSASDFKKDVLAGLVVGIVALPLAMALGIAVGVPPQHGLYTAIVAGFVVALLGGSRTRVSGPTAAFVVVLAPLYAEYGLAGLLFSGLLGGFILILMGVFRLGALIQFVPHPVTTGFTAGIATVIAVLQLRDLLGLQLTTTPSHFLDRILAMGRALGTVSWGEALLGATTLALLIALPRVSRRVPAPLVALPLATLLALLLEQFLPELRIDTIATRFEYVVDGVTSPGIPQLPPTPVLPWAPNDAAALAFDTATLRALLASAFTIAMLGAIESLLSAVVADGMARTRHDPDAELIALGVGNVLAPFLGGIAATGAIARTATNVRAGARSPIAAVVHALTVLAAVLALAPLLGYVPMSSLAALLLVVAWNMSDIKHVAHLLRVAPRSDVLVFGACYVLTVLVDMVVGVAVGMVLAALLFMRRMAEVTQTRVSQESHPELPEGDLPKGVVIYEISGPLFFGAAQKAVAALHVVGRPNGVVILGMAGVSVMDATGLVALESALGELDRHGCLAILCGVREQPGKLLEKAQLDAHPRVVRCPDMARALARAREHLAAGTSRQVGT